MEPSDSIILGLCPWTYEDPVVSAIIMIVWLSLLLHGWHPSSTSPFKGGLSQCSRFELPKVKSEKSYIIYTLEKIDVALLQETHFPKRYCPTFIHSKFPTFYTANDDDKTKGVAILFYHKCNFSLQIRTLRPRGQIHYWWSDILFCFILRSQKRAIFSFPIHATTPGSYAGRYSYIWGSLKDCVLSRSWSNALSDLLNRACVSLKSFFNMAWWMFGEKLTQHCVTTHTTLAHITLLPG